MDIQAKKKCGYDICISYTCVIVVKYSFLLSNCFQLATCFDGFNWVSGGDNKTGYTFLKVVLHIQQTQNNFDNPRLTFLFPPFSSPPSPEENLGVFGN